MAKKNSKRSYTLDWTFVPRVVVEHFGSQKYSTSAAAIGELVANALDADASVVDVEVTYNELEGPHSIIISDDGRGISPKELESRFVVVGVEPGSVAGRMPRFGRFGVGRLAVHRIGSLSTWTTVADVEGKGRIRSSFVLRSDDRGALKIEEEVVPPATPLGTHIAIANLRDTGKDTLSPSRIANDLLAQFCSFLLGNRNRQIRVQDEKLNVDQMVEKYDVEQIPALEHISQPSKLAHLILTRPIERTRFPAQVVFSAKGRTVASFQPTDVPSPYYLGVVECSYLDSIVTSNREALIEMDSGFSQLRSVVAERVKLFAERLRKDRKRRFIMTARQEDYYPFRNPPVDAVADVQQAIYDVVLEKVNEHANLEALTKKQQAVVFRLLERSLDNENILSASTGGIAFRRRHGEVPEHLREDDSRLDHKDGLRGYKPSVIPGHPSPASLWISRKALGRTNTAPPNT